MTTQNMCFLVDVRKIKKVLVFFLFVEKNIRCGYSLEASRRDASNEFPQHIFFLDK